MEKYRIWLNGRVQGVGFRPFVYRVATSMSLCGSVNNTDEGVFVEVWVKDKQELDVFCQKLLQETPQLAKITHFEVAVSDTENQVETDFSILKSESIHRNNVLICPDFAICETCKTEIQTSSNRRWGYAFTTCTNCGPRYSIINRLPYDREYTAMQEFEMCTACSNEYADVTNRRYFSQTNSCTQCGIRLQLFDKNTNLLEDNQELAITKSVNLLQNGYILAVKGIGGYLLLCDAQNQSTIIRLRERKNRPSKPFATMFPSLEVIEQRFPLHRQEREYLTNEIASIVLLSGEMEHIAAGGNVGVMLPYTPLFQLISNQFGKALVATSANISNAPIIFNDKDAFDSLSEIADYFLVNNRQIIIPQDDSLIKFSPQFHTKIILRRSRGLAPNLLLSDEIFPDKVLAMGAMLKSTFALTHEKNIYVSQYLGDLDDFDTQQSYLYVLENFLKILGNLPEVILIDCHESYPSVVIGQELAEKWSVPCFKIQHHQAHFGAVLTENNLLHSSQAILGIIWDGTGLGLDKQIWGGEFFVYQNYEISRLKHFDYFPSILGDKMSREPRLSALALCQSFRTEALDDFLKPKFSDSEWAFYSKQIKATNLLKTSSVGRIFDGIASLLGLIDKVSYEGEAAMLLEQKAQEYFEQEGLIKQNYITSSEDSTKCLMKGIWQDLLGNCNQAEIALKVHVALVDLIGFMADELNIKQLCFSGGVWQNTLLVDLVQLKLTKYQLYFHRDLAPNDENISFGQVAIYSINQQFNRQ